MIVLTFPARSFGEISHEFALTAAHVSTSIYTGSSISSYSGSLKRLTLVLSTIWSEPNFLIALLPLTWYS